MFTDLKYKYNVTHMTSARQRLDKHVPEITLSTTERRPLLGKALLSAYP
jgi:hypothetical protein